MSFNKDSDFLIENHIEFLTSHRGKLMNDGCCLAIQSEKPEFTFALMTDSCTLKMLADKYSTVYLYPAAQNQEPDLLNSNYKEIGTLSYMVLNTNTNAWQVLPELRVKLAKDKAEFDEFSQVQAGGFCETEEIYKAWYPFLSAANHKNRANVNQRFYIGYLNGSPVGVCLIVINSGVAGIYAVATLPEFRKKGISTSIMKQAIAEAHESGCHTVTLQVVGKSYAESFYEKLGFETKFISRIFKR